MCVCGGGGGYRGPPRSSYSSGRVQQSSSARLKFTYGSSSGRWRLPLRTDSLMTADLFTTKTSIIFLPTFFFFKFFNRSVQNKSPKRETSLLSGSPSPFRRNKHKSAYGARSLAAESALCLWSKHDIIQHLTKPIRLTQ